MAGVRRGAFTCVGWQVTLCDPIWQVTSCSSEMGFPWRSISAFTFTFTSAKERLVSEMTYYVSNQWDVKLYSLTGCISLYFTHQCTLCAHSVYGATRKIRLSSLSRNFLTPRLIFNNFFTSHSTLKFAVKYSTTPQTRRYTTLRNIVTFE